VDTKRTSKAGIPRTTEHPATLPYFGHAEGLSKHNRSQLLAIADISRAWQQRERMDMIVIPVQIGIPWLLYMTERNSYNKTVLRLATADQ
jgi:hypothetical protein